MLHFLNFFLEKIFAFVTRGKNFALDQNKLIVMKQNQLMAYFFMDIFTLLYQLLIISKIQISNNQSCLSKTTYFYATNIVKTKTLQANNKFLYAQ